MVSQFKYRHETKHEIRYSEYLAIKSRLKVIAGLDKNVGEASEYFIRSLYFDNYQDKALREKIYGVNIREKFRLRYYNGNDQYINLEKKQKNNGLCHKESVGITKEEVLELLKGNYEFLKESTHPLKLEFYTKVTNQLLRPRVIVDYVREPYIYEPGNMRITFDKNIRSGLYSQDFFNPNMVSIPVASQDTVLLEVKYDEFLPEVIAMCLQVNERQKSAFSKYATSRMFG